MAGVAHRGRGEGSIYQRKDGRWCAQASVGYDVVTGRPKRRTVYGRTRREVADKLTSLLAGVREGKLAEPSKETLGHFLERWLRDYVAHGVRPSTLSSYEMLIRRHVLPSLGNLRLRDLQTAHVQKLYSDLLQTGRVNGRGGLSPRTVRYVHAVLHSALTQAVREGLLTANPAEAAKKPRPQSREIRPLTPPEQACFLSAAKGDELYAAWLLFLATGLRRGELLGLRWQDIDLEGAVLHVRQSAVPIRGQTVLSTPKTSAGVRTVTLPAAAVRVLQQHRGVQAAQKLQLGAAYRDYGLVFCQADGRPWDIRAFSRRFERLMKRIGLEGHTLHDLRHTHATMLLELGINPKVVQERLGHAHVGITLGTYSHVLPGLQEAAAARIDAALLGR